MVLRLALALREAGDEPSLVSTREGWMTERARAAGLTVRIQPQRPGLDPGFVPRLARLLRADGIELFHGHEFLMNVYGGLAARLMGIPRVSTVHGPRYVTERGRRRVAYRWLHRGGMRLVAVSGHLAEHLSEGLGLPLAAIDVVPNGVPLPAPAPDPGEARRRARAELELPADGPLVLAVGNLYPVKDHARLLRAAARLPGVRVAVAGRGGEEESLRRQAESLGIAERVHLLGLRDDVDRLLTAADLFTQPSRSEGLPLAVLEAMAAGLAVVATDVGGMGQAVIDGETGVLIPADDEGALPRALGALLDDPARAERLGAAGRRRVEAEFSVEAMARRYRALYAEASA